MVPSVKRQAQKRRREIGCIPKECPPVAWRKVLDEVPDELWEEVKRLQEEEVST
jgi:hypothetical protein